METFEDVYKKYEEQIKEPCLDTFIFNYQQQKIDALGIELNAANAALRSLGDIHGKLYDQKEEFVKCVEQIAGYQFDIAKKEIEVILRLRGWATQCLEKHNGISTTEGDE